MEVDSVPPARQPRHLPPNLQFEIIKRCIEGSTPSLYYRDGLEESSAAMSDLNRFSLVSKAWNNHVTPLLYKNIILRYSSKIDYHIPILQFEETLSTHRPDLALLVHSFRIDVPPGSWDYPELDIITLLHLLPNLQHLDLRPSEHIETALNRTRPYSWRPNPPPKIKPKPLSLTLSLPAYQLLTPNQIKAIYPDGDAPASTFKLKDFFDTSFLVSLDLYSQHGSYLFDNIISETLPPSLRKISVRIDSWAPYNPGNATNLLKGLKKIGGQLEFFHLQCKTWNHGLPLSKEVLQSLPKVKTLSLDIDTWDLVGSLRGGNESIETLFFGRPSRPRSEPLRESKSVSAVWEEVC